MSDKTRCRECAYAATDARSYPCNRCKEVQYPRKDLVDFYAKKESEK